MVGLPIDTQLWIADLPDGTYLRAGSSDVEWLGRLESGGAPALEREDQNGADRNIHRRMIRRPAKPFERQWPRSTGSQIVCGSPFTRTSLP